MSSLFDIGKSGLQSYRQSLAVTGQNIGLPGDKIPAWKVTIPDGNYEQRWMAANEAEAIELAVNNAIALAEPGYLDQESGFAHFHPCQDISKFPNAKLRPSHDICFTVDRASGKGIIAAPDPPDNGLSKFENHGFTLRWCVNNDGKLDMDTTAQLRFGWQLGFRAGSYICGGVPYHPKWTEDITDLSNNMFSQQTVGSAVSEGVVLITGPRYCFLAINDHKTSTGPAMLVAYANSTLDDNIITRINLTSTMSSTHAFQYSDNPGQTTQLNRKREYFGPVDIHRLEITLYDEYGRFLDLNNMDWSFTLAFEKLYT